MEQIIKFCDGSMDIDKLNKINKLADEYFALSKEAQNRILSQLWQKDDYVIYEGKKKLNNLVLNYKLIDKLI